MFKMIKEYVTLLNTYNNESNLDQVIAIEKKLLKFKYDNLNIKINNIWIVLDRFNVKFPIGIYIDYYENNFIKDINIFNNKDELNFYLNKNWSNIKNTWWLNCYLSLTDTSFLELHYQDTLILYKKGWL